MSRETEEKSEVYRFGECVIDAARREITLAGELVTTQPKAFELLLYLIRNRHRVVDKDELQDVLWPRSIVTETALTRCVMKARRAVGDDADRQVAIKTVHGTGYRFAADLDDDIEPAVHLPESKTPRQPFNWSVLKIPGAVAALTVLVVSAWLLFAPMAFSGPVRLAVLPFENATGDAELDWIETGLMAMMTRTLADQGVDTINVDAMSESDTQQSISALLATGSEFRDRMSRSSAATHFLGASLQQSGGLYRLTYTLAGHENRPMRRTLVGREPTRLVKEITDTIVHLTVDAPPPTTHRSSVSNDEFLNEAFARGMSLYHEGRYEDAKDLFEMIIEQEPHLFWPRYERALAIRNLRDFEAAERELIALRDEAAGAALLDEHAAAENALGKLYWERRRNDEARVAYENTIRLGNEAEDPLRAATGYQNLALVEKSIGDLPKALEHMRAAEQIYASLDIEYLPGTLHNNLSGVLILQGQLEEAERHSLKAIESFQFSGQRLFESYALNRLSSIYRRQRLLDDALEFAERAMAIRQDLGNQFGVAATLLNMAEISFDKGDLTRSTQFAQQAIDIAQEIDSQMLVVGAMFDLAKVNLALKQGREAADRYAAIEALALTNNDRINVFAARLGQVNAQTLLGDFDTAMSGANELLAETREHDRQREETGVLRAIARIHVARSQYAEAITILQEVHQIASDIGDNGVRVSTSIDLAETYIRLSDAEAAAPYVEVAAAERPGNAETLKVQAGLAALRGDLLNAARIMGEARSAAGESWSSDDTEVLASYREAVAMPDE